MGTSFYLISLPDSFNISPLITIEKKNPILEEKKNRLLLPYWFLEIFFSHPKKEETLKSMICTLNVTKPSSSYEKLLSTYFKHSVHVCVSAYIYV